jgi:hypothetical protein
MNNDLLSLSFNLLKVIIQYGELTDNGVFNKKKLQVPQKTKFINTSIDFAIELIDVLKEDIEDNELDIESLAHFFTESGYAGFNDELSANAFARLANLTEYRGENNHQHCKLMALTEGNDDDGKFFVM